MEVKENIEKEYELSLLLSPQIDEGELSGFIQEFNSYIGNLNGRIIKSNSVKKQGLFYPVKKFKNSYLTFFSVLLNPEKIKELEKKLKLEDRIIRYLFVAQPPAKKITRIPRERPRPKVLVPAPPPAPAPPPIKAKREEIKIEELDKKLKEILEE